MTGTLADGSVLSASGRISVSNTWAVYATPVGGKEQLAGTVTFVTGSKPAFSGSLEWSSQPNPKNRRYPAGFDATVGIDGNLFFPATLKSSALSAGLFTATLIDGASSFTDSVQFAPPAKLSPAAGPNRLTLQISATTGLVSGSFLDAQTGRLTSLHGVILEQENRAAGYYLTTSSSGAFTLSAP